MANKKFPDRRTLLLSAFSTSLLAGCGGSGAGTAIGSVGSSSSSSASSSSSSLTSSSSSSSSSSADPTTQYHLTFDDEFASFVSSRWQTSDFWGMRNNPGDYQAQWFADPTSVPTGETKVPYNPFQITNGTLGIVAVPTPANTYSGPGNLPYVSGQLTSANKFTQRYGYYELRAKLPAGKGLWSRFWLLTDDGVWPGEYDIFEVLGKETFQIHETTHYSDATHPHIAEGTTYTAINPTDGQFHTYGFLWDAAGVTWYVDGVATLTQANRISIPMYVLIDLAVGNDPGNLWPGNPDSSTSWPSTMEIDYFRIYSNDPSLPRVEPDSGYTPSILPKNFTVVPGPAVGPLPAGWAATAIGTPDLKGSSTWNPNTGEWILKGAGYGNQCQFAGTTLAGDGVVAATIQSLTRINSNDDRAGVAMRTSIDESAPEISLVYMTSYNSPSTATRVVLISRGGTPTVELAATNVSIGPIRLQLKRQGNLFIGSYSTDDGLTWMEIGRSQVNALSGALQAGLVVGGNQNNYLRLTRAIITETSLVTG